MRGGERSERLRGVLLRLPRWLRVVLAVWGAIGFFPFLFSIPLAMLSAAFDAPSVLSAGRIPAVMDQNQLPVAFLLGLPLGLLMLLGEQRKDWNNWRDATLRGFMAILVALFILLVGSVAARTISDSLALSVNAIVKPPLQAWTMQINEVRLSKSTRNCPKHLYFDDPVAPGHRSEICVYQLDPLFQVGVGDVLHLSGKSGPFGITYRRNDLRLEKGLPVSN